MGGRKASPEEPPQLLPPAGSLDAADVEGMEASRDDGSVTIDSPPSLQRPAVKSWRGEARHRSDAGTQRHVFGEGATSKFNARGGGGDGGPHGREDGESAAVSSSVEMLGMLSVNVFGDQPHGNGNGSSILQVRERNIDCLAYVYIPRCIPGMYDA